MEDKKKELEQKYFLYQFLKEQLDYLGNQAESVRMAMIETQASINVLEEITSGKNSKNTLIPLGAGTFVEGKLENVDKIMVTIGNDVVIKEDVSKAKKRLIERLKEMEVSYEKMLKDSGSLAAQIQSILPEVERLAGEMNYSDSNNQDKN